MVVILCVWSVKSPLPFGASVHPENAVTYSMGNEGQIVCVIFSKTALLQSYNTSSIVYTAIVGHFLTAEHTNVLLRSHVPTP